MSNVLGVYDPLFYAQEALEQLHKALGMAARVYRGMDKSPQQRGSTISIPIPQTFVAADAPATATDLKPSEVQVVLNKWREVKFTLSDKELTFTTEKIINDHIVPAAYALADDIDQTLVAQYKTIPWYLALSSSAAIADITGARKILFNNKVPMNDLHLMVNGTAEAEFLNLAAFSALGGSAASEATQMRGSLGEKFGFEVFANQNVAAHTGGVAADPDGAIDLAANYAAGATTVHIDGVTVDGTAKVGDILEITGHTQKYAITEDVTFAAGEGDVKIAPGLEKATNDDTVVKLIVGNAIGENLAFRRDAFVLAMAPLTEIGNQLGARIATVSDPVTGLALRSRMYYIGDTSQVYVALDVLYGVKTLNCNKAVRIRDAS